MSVRIEIRTHARQKAAARDAGWDPKVLTRRNFSPRPEEDQYPSLAVGGEGGRQRLQVARRKQRCRRDPHASALVKHLQQADEGNGLAEGSPGRRPSGAKLEREDEDRVEGSVER